ncbi:ATP-binding protein [Streptomyces tsukubensis]|uniref:ATP-binding protein n=1 Tax=Streptomyces tsukubensis TaxID=83656 RepID=UPI00344E295C
MTVKPAPTGHPGYSETLPRAPESAAVARRLVRTALSAWGLPSLIDDAVLVMTELVSNASRHAARPSIRVMISRPSDHSVCLGVADRSRVVPTMRPDCGGDRGDGRGLVLVSRLTSCWGTDLHHWGKQVWGVLTHEPTGRPVGTEHRSETWIHCGRPVDATHETSDRSPSRAKRPGDPPAGPRPGSAPPPAAPPGTGCARPGRS